MKVQSAVESIEWGKKESTNILYHNIIKIIIINFIYQFYKIYG